MEFITNLTLCVAAISASAFCWVLSRRLKRFASLDQGIGAAVIELSRKVDELQKSVMQAKRIASVSRHELETQSRQAEELARRLELILAASHDLRPTESVDLDREVEWPLS